MRKIEITCSRQWGVHNEFFTKNIKHINVIEDENDEWRILGAFKNPTNTKRDTANLDVWYLRKGCCQNLQDIIDILYFLSQYFSPINLASGVLPTEYFEDGENLVIRSFVHPTKEVHKFAGWKNALPALNAALIKGEVFLEVPRWVGEEIPKRRMFEEAGFFEKKISELGYQRVCGVSDQTGLKCVEKIRQAKKQAQGNAEKAKPSEGDKILVFSTEGKDGRLVGRAWTSRGAGMFLFPISGKKFSKEEEYWWAEIVAINPGGKSGRIKLIDRV